LFGKLTEQLCSSLPFAGVAFSAILLCNVLAARLGGIIPSLYGTFMLILLTSIVKHFPFASRSGSANMMQISVELEEAADIAGASFWRRIRSIVIPLAKNGFISGFMLVFISIAKELDDCHFDDARELHAFVPRFRVFQELMPQCAGTRIGLSILRLFWFATALRTLWRDLGGAGL
jgi:hypothetical protein